MIKTVYDLIRIKAVVFDVDGVLSPVCVPLGNDGVPRRMANLRDGYALQLAIRKGIKIAVITGCNDVAVEKRLNLLGIKDIYFTSTDKLEVLKKWMSEQNLISLNVAYVGDDIPDLQCLRYAGLAVCPSDAAVEAKNTAHYITDAAGGYGVARELLEQILKVRNAWPDVAHANGL